MTRDRLNLIAARWFFVALAVLAVCWLFGNVAGTAGALASTIAAIVVYLATCEPTKETDQP